MVMLLDPAAADAAAAAAASPWGHRRNTSHSIAGPPLYLLS